MTTLSKNRRTYNTPGDAHALTLSCYKRMPLLRSGRTKAWLCEAINKARKRFDFELWAFVFMPEHVHLIAHPNQEEYDIDRFRASIKSEVTKRALRFLRENDVRSLERLRVGQSATYRFWQDGPGYDRNLRSPKAIWQAIDYLHTNPVRRGLCECIEEYEWSSAREYLGLKPAPLHVDICSVFRPQG